MCLKITALPEGVVAKPEHKAMRAGHPEFLIRTSEKYQNLILVKSDQPAEECSVDMNGQGYNYVDDELIYGTVLDAFTGKQVRDRKTLKVRTDAGYTKRATINGGGIMEEVINGEVVLTHRAVRLGKRRKAGEAVVAGDPDPRENWFYAFYPVAQYEAWKQAGIDASAEEVAEPVEA